MSFLLTKNPPIFQFDKMKKNNNRECSVDRHRNKKKILMTHPKNIENTPK